MAITLRCWSQHNQRDIPTDAAKVMVNQEALPGQHSTGLLLPDDGLEGRLATS
jgi:hypothetical protein